MGLGEAMGIGEDGGEDGERGGEERRRGQGEVE